MTPETMDRVRSDIESLLNDRCCNGWKAQVTEYDEDDVDVSLTFDGGGRKFSASFIARADENRGTVFYVYDGDGEGEEIEDMLWQWLFWKLLDKAGK